MSLLTIDSSYMLNTALGDAGLAADHTLGLVSALESCQRQLGLMVNDSETGTFANTFRRPEVDQVRELAASLKGRFEDFVLIGIGGSTWGTIALQAALCHGWWNDNAELRAGHPRFHVLDNSDPDALRELLEQIDPARTLVNVVSKSGTTAETAANFLSLAERFRQDLGEGWKSHFVLTTDHGDGLLQRIGREEGLALLPIPPKTGGRFSLLSAVGLFPCEMLGIDTARLLAGAEAITLDAMNAPLEENRTLQAAAATYSFFQSGPNINVLMPYARRLRHVADWYVQLWGESLGKKYNKAGQVVHSGSTPLGALGAADQHSLLQLFMEGPKDKLVSFIRLEAFGGAAPIGRAFEQHEAIAYLAGQDMSRLINAEQESTAEALKAEGRASRTISLPELDAYWLGQLFQFFMLETFFNGELMGINTFDQPGVEAGKVLTYGRMGRRGFSA